MNGVRQILRCDLPGVEARDSPDGARHTVVNRIEPPGKADLGDSQVTQFQSGGAAHLRESDVRGHHQPLDRRVAFHNDGAALTRGPACKLAIRARHSDQRHAFPPAVCRMRLALH